MIYNIAIGYDRNNRMPAYTTAESIMQNSSIPVNIMFLHRNMLTEFTRESNNHDSTEFSNSRFLVPYLYDYQNWTLFLDNDMIIKSDIKELFDMRDEKYSIMCVKHNQICNADKKFSNKDQHQYQFKNWSSVILFNNKKCKALSLEYVNTAPGLDLHQFKWLTDSRLIGSLPLEWNYLIDNKNQTTKEPKLLHYTDGGPYFNSSRNCGYADDWWKVYNTINDIEK